jgi:hypothetical protein
METASGMARRNTSIAPKKQAKKPQRPRRKLVSGKVVAADRSAARWAEEEAGHSEVLGNTKSGRFGDKFADGGIAEADHQENRKDDVESALAGGVDRGLPGPQDIAAESAGSGAGCQGRHAVKAG